MQASTYPLHEAEHFRYVDEGPHSERPPVMLLHGMLGDLSNWTSTIGALAEAGYRVIVPVLPVYSLPLRKTSIPGLVEYTRAFAEAINLPPAILVGNSLGGQLALFYTLQYQADVLALVLSGSSGIYEVTMGTSTPRRYDPEYVRERAAATFYDPRHATDELVEEMLAVVQNREQVVRLIKMARAQKQASVTEHLSQIRVPAFIIWGEEDQITPPDVAREFQQRLPDAQLRMIPACGHAPMIEHPSLFNRYLLEFLDQVSEPSSSVSAQDHD